MIAGQRPECGSDRWRDCASARLGGGCSHELVNAFDDALALTRQPQKTLHALYQGWTVTVQSLRAALVTGIFSLPASTKEATDRAKALRECLHLDGRISEIHATAGKEKQVCHRVELNLILAQLRADRGVCETITRETLHG